MTHPYYSPEWEQERAWLSGEIHSFEIPEYRCGGFGLLVALAFVVSFFTTFGVLSLFL